VVLTKDDFCRSEYTPTHKLFTSYTPVGFDPETPLSAGAQQFTSIGGIPKNMFNREMFSPVFSFNSKKMLLARSRSLTSVCLGLEVDSPAWLDRRLS
jgi:hypothetical protein